MFLLQMLVAMAAPTAVPGTSVTLDPPEGFTLSEQFPGFSDGAIGSIMVTELPVSAVEMQTQMTAEAIASRGMTELGRETHGKAVLVKVAQATGDGRTVHKWMRIDGDPERTVMVVGTVLEGDARVEAVKQALQTVTLAEKPTEPHPATIAYAITPAKGWATAGTLQTMQLFSLGGKAPPLADDEPRFMVGPSVSPVDLTDLEGFAQQRLAQLPFQGMHGDSVETLTVGGRPAVELTATGKAPGNEVQRVIYQLVVAQEDGTYHLAVGIGADKKELKQFREMGRSLRFDVQ